MSGEAAINSSFHGARGIGASVAANGCSNQNAARKMKTADFTSSAKFKVGGGRGKRFLNAGDHRWEKLAGVNVLVQWKWLADAETLLIRKLRNQFRAGNVEG